ncbi:MAG: amylo-alpha-1,6-glucosidase [Patescibacteria group bacterium]
MHRSVVSHIKLLWTVLFWFLLLLPFWAQAEQIDFLDPVVDSFNASLVCTGWEDGGCRSMFLIAGKNFLNSNGSAGVKVGNEWADVLRATNSLIVAIASEGALKKAPIVSLDTTLNTPSLTSLDPVLDGLFADSVEVALSAIEQTDDGTRYISAGPKYDDVPRVYYRDSYWASGMILMIEPYVVRDQILLLAKGIEIDGSVPSATPVDQDGYRLSLWEDHLDSGPYFDMLVYDYVRWTGDTSILSERVNGRTIFAAMEDVLSYLSTRDTDGDLLPEKPENSLQDWLDSIPRSGEVLSNQVLYYRALRNLVEISTLMNKPTHAKAFHRQSLLVRFQINRLFWNDEDGTYFESCYKEVCVERVTNESALAILYEVVWPQNRDRLFESLLTLESARNDEIPYGDWGVVNAWPLYDGFTPYDYQNGTDWPYLDGINAGARLKYGNADWHYPLTRWWSFNEEQGSGRVLPEYVSPVDEDGGDEQAWSVNPAVSFVRYGLGVDPDLAGAYTTKHSPNGEILLRNVFVRGHRISVNAQ